MEATATAVEDHHRRHGTIATADGLATTDLRHETLRGRTFADGAALGVIERHRLRITGTAASISTAAAARLKPRTRPATGFAILIVRETYLMQADGSRTRHAMIRFAAL